MKLVEKLEAIQENISKEEINSLKAKFKLYADDLEWIIKSMDKIKATKEIKRAKEIALKLKNLSVTL